MQDLFNAAVRPPIAVRSHPGCLRAPSADGSRRNAIRRGGSRGRTAGPCSREIRKARVEATRIHAQPGICTSSSMVSNCRWRESAGMLSTSPSLVAPRKGIDTLTMVGRRTASTTNRHRMPLIRNNRPHTSSEIGPPPRLLGNDVICRSTAIRNAGQSDQASPDHPADTLIVLERQSLRRPSRTPSAAASTRSGQTASPASWPQCESRRRSPGLLGRRGRKAPRTPAIS